MESFWVQVPMQLHLRFFKGSHTHDSSLFMTPPLESGWALELLWPVDYGRNDSVPLSVSWYTLSGSLELPCKETYYSSQGCQTGEVVCVGIPGNSPSWPSLPAKACEVKPSWTLQAKLFAPWVPLSDLNQYHKENRRIIQLTSAQILTHKIMKCNKIVSLSQWIWW